MAVCRAYAIRPYPAGQKFIGVSVRFYPMNQKSDRNWIHPATGVAVCGAYAIRPYTGDLKNGDFSVRSTTDVVVCRAYSIRPYTGEMKNGDFSIRSASDVAVCGAHAIRPYPTGQKFIGVSVCFYPMNEIIVIFLGTRVGAYCIRPTNGYVNGQMNGKMDGVLVRFYPMNQKSDRN